MMINDITPGSPYVTDEHQLDWINLQFRVIK